MAKKDPTYFSELKSVVYSGDYMKTEEKLAEGGKLIAKVVKDNKAAIEKHQQMRPEVGAYLVEIYTMAGAITHVVLVTGGAGVVEVVVYYAATWWTHSSKKNDSSKMKREMIVKNVVSKLAN